MLACTRCLSFDVDPVPSDTTLLKRLPRRILLDASQLFDRMSRACVHMAAGLTSIGQMRIGVRYRWQDFSLGDDCVDSGLMPWEIALADAYVKPGARVLVVGCGSGRDVLPLVRRGCVVVGVDPAETAVETGRRALAARGLSATLFPGFFEDLHWDPEFDVVWFSYFAYTYIPDSRRRVAVLQLAAEALAPGGRILISVYGHTPQERLSWLGTLVGRLTHNDWLPGRGDRFCVQPGTRLLRYEHHFSETALREEFRQARLQVIHSAEAGTVFALEPIPGTDGPGRPITSCSTAG
jgi:SAM-dependent methyltransferase